jgi:hypothetical protein
MSSRGTGKLAQGYTPAAGLHIRKSSFSNPNLRLLHDLKVKSVLSRIPFFLFVAPFVDSELASIRKSNLFDGSVGFITD